jgi:hypothetical protein
MRQNGARGACTLLLAYSHGESLQTAEFSGIMDFMLEDIQILFVPALVVAVVVIALWHRYAFVMRVRRGRPRVIKGKVAGPFLEEVADVCREAALERGWVGGVRHGKRIVLVFSWHIPASIRQRLRNLWVIHA